MEVFCVMRYTGGSDEELWNIYCDSVTAFNAAKENCNFCKDSQHTYKVFSEVINQEGANLRWRYEHLNPGDFFIQRMEVIG